MNIAPDKPQRAESVTERIAKELDHFLLLPNTDPDADPLSWWKREQQSFPILAQLACKYLCVCGTSVPSERLFSQAGYIVNELRTHRPDKPVPPEFHLGWEELLEGSDDSEELPLPNIDNIDSLLLAASQRFEGPLGDTEVGEMDKLFLQASQSYELMASE